MFGKPKTWMPVNHVLRKSSCSETCFTTLTNAFSKGDADTVWCVLDEHSALPVVFHVAVNELLFFWLHLPVGYLIFTSLETVLPPSEH